MLKLTKNTDYALMAINFIACREDNIASTRTISAVYNIPMPLLAKILQRLAKSGLIVSQSGPKGGYKLSKPASQITLSEVIHATEGPIHITRCCDGDHTCLQSERCSVQGPLQKIEKKIVALFDQTTIEQMYEITEGAEKTEEAFHV